MYSMVFKVVILNMSDDLIHCFLTGKYPDQCYTLKGASYPMLVSKTPGGIGWLGRSASSLQDGK